MSRKSYLEGFFNRYDYCREDAQVLLNTYDRIVENPETDAIWKEAIDLYNESINCDYMKILELTDEVAMQLYLQEYTVYLLIFICLSQRAEKVYESHGIDRQIFHDNMLDLKFKLEECKLVKGIVGTFVPRWFIGFFNLTKFTLGRLQFEIAEFGYNYERDGKILTPQSKVINVHIPRTLKPLDEKSCDESFEKAKEYFADEIGDVCAFICYSWLLYPENKNILPQNSNTYRFMSRFDVIKSKIYKNREDLWRLFDTDEKNVDRLPTDTSMRRAYIKHLKQGGKTGYGFGVFFL